MKRKLIIVVIAVVLVAALVGGCFALYRVNATPKTINLGVNGDGVTLVLNTTENFALTELNPQDSKTLAVTLTASPVANVTAGRYGKFTVVIEPAVENDEEDEALATAISVAASGTYADNSAYSADNATLIAGQDILLTRIPTTMTLTFSLPGVTNDAFKDIAGGSVSVTLKWEPVPWAMSDSLWYILGSMNAWTPAEDFELIVDTSGNNQYILLGVALAEGQEFKVRRGHINNESTDWKNVDADHSSAVSNGHIGYANGNCLVRHTGTYNVYINNDWQVIIEDAA